MLIPRRSRESTIPSRPLRHLTAHNTDIAQACSRGADTGGILLGSRSVHGRKGREGKNKEARRGRERRVDRWMTWLTPTRRAAIPTVKLEAPRSSFASNSSICRSSCNEVQSTSTPTLAGTGRSRRPEQQHRQTEKLANSQVGPTLRSKQPGAVLETTPAAMGELRSLSLRIRTEAERCTGIKGLTALLNDQAEKSIAQSEIKTLVRTQLLSLSLQSLTRGLPVWKKGSHRREHVHLPSTLGNDAPLTFA